MNLYTTTKLPSGIVAQIFEPDALTFFKLMTSSSGDTGLFIEHLMMSIVKIDNQFIQAKQLQSLSFQDLMHIVETIGPILNPTSSKNQF